MRSSEKSFVANIRSGVRKLGYNFEDKALDIYACLRPFGVMPKTDTTKLFGGTGCLSLLRVTSTALASSRKCSHWQLRFRSIRWYEDMALARHSVHSSWQKSETFAAFFQESLGGICGYDAPSVPVWQMDVYSRSISKRGSSSRRRTLFQWGFICRTPARNPYTNSWTESVPKRKPIRFT